MSLPTAIAESYLDAEDGKRGAAFGGGAPPSRKALDLPRLVTVAFFWVSGGIYGNEVLVEAAAPLYVFAGLVLFPLAYSLPTALITAELATALPEDGGPVVWVQEAFGSTVGGHVAFWMWTTSVMDTATYPTLAVNFLRDVCPLPANANLLTSVGFVVTITAVKFRGIRETTVMSAVFMVIATLPVVVYVALGMRGLKLQTITATTGENNWGLLMNWMMWTFAGFWSIGSIAGQVDQPQRVYPKLAAILVVLVVVQNALPMAVSLSQDGRLSDFRVGHFAELAGRLGGAPLRVAFVVAAWVCQLGTCNAMSITADRVLAHFLESRLDALGLGLGAGSGAGVCAGGKRRGGGLWSWVMSVQQETGIRPVYTLFNAALMCLFAALPLKCLVSSEMLLFAAVSATSLAAFVELKRRRPDMPRAFAVPGGVPGAAALVALPVAMTLAQVALNVLDAVKSGEGKSRLFGVCSVVAVGLLCQRLTVNLLSLPHREA